MVISGTFNTLFVSSLSLGVVNMPYPARLESLGAESLETRRIKCDLTMYFKILNGIVDLNSESLLQVSDMRTRNNGLTLYKAKFNCNLER